MTVRVEDRIQAELRRINCPQIIWDGMLHDSAEIDLGEDTPQFTGLSGEDLFEALKTVPENPTPETARDILIAFKYGMIHEGMKQ